MSAPLRIAVYDLYWSTLGGGEQVDGTLASVLAEDHDVTLLGVEPIDVDLTRERLGIDLGRCAQRIVYDDDEASVASADYDIFVNGSYGSTAVNRAPLGWYYVHFPLPAPASKVWWRPSGGLRGALGRRRPAVDTHAFLPTYHRYLANSSFTAHWTEQLWDVPTEVLYPPVQPQVAPGEKRALILNVGRFFRSYHSKKQLELIEAFARDPIDGWELALAGGCDAAHRDYAMSARRAASGQPIRIHINARGDLVRRLFAESSIYWHASGFGEDEQRTPERFEHFGITVVEALAAGAVPIVYGAGGPAEIVQDGVHGYHWHDLDELMALTRRVATDVAERGRLSAAAEQRARDFSTARFAGEVRTRLP